MFSPKQLVLDAASDGPFPLSKSELLGRLDEQVIDPDVLVSVSLLDDVEFSDTDDLTRAIDMAFGMPDAFADESVLEHEVPRAQERDTATRRRSPAGNDVGAWDGSGRDLTVVCLRSLLDGLDDDALVTIELDDAEGSEPMVPIGVRIDERAGTIVLEAARRNSA